MEARNFTFFDNCQNCLVQFMFLPAWNQVDFVEFRVRTRCSFLLIFEHHKYCSIYRTVNNGLARHKTLLFIRHVHFNWTEPHKNASCPTNEAGRTLARSLLIRSRPKPTCFRVYQDLNNFFPAVFFWLLFNFAVNSYIKKLLENRLSKSQQQTNIN